MKRSNPLAVTCLGAMKIERQGGVPRLEDAEPHRSLRGRRPRGHSLALGQPLRPAARTITEEEPQVAVKILLKPSLLESMRLSLELRGNSANFAVFSRMRSEGFPFIVWGSGGWTLVRIVLLGASRVRRGRVDNSVPLGFAWIRVASVCARGAAARDGVSRGRRGEWWKMRA